MEVMQQLDWTCRTQRHHLCATPDHKPAATMSTLLSAGHLPPNRHDDLDNYDVGDDDPFATPSPPSSPPPPKKKRKEPASASQGQGGGGGLGIDEEVSVAKRARLPNVKLDEDR